MRSVLVLAGLLFSMPVLAQNTANAPAPAATAPAPVDAMRLAAARDLIDTIMPPPTRAAMLDNIVRPMTARMQQGMAENPQFAQLFADDPRARTLLQQFLQRTTERTLSIMRPAMPEMWEIMARAYARRFSVAQLQEVRAFFQTPTGQVYMQQSLTIMADPELGAWQQDLMRRSMSHLQDDVAEVTRQLTELPEHHR